MIDPASPTPILPAKPSVPSSGVTVNPLANLATHALVFFGAITSTLGFAHASTIIDGVANSSFFSGIVVSGLGLLVSHFNVSGSNSNTLELANTADQVLQVLTSLIQKQPATPTTPVNPTPTV